MKLSSLILLIVALGCHTKQLEVGQLKFGDFEREFIARNHVDTTYLIGKNPWIKSKFGEMILSNGDNTNFLNWKFMDVGFVVYDSLGRIISDESMRSQDYRYFYDSRGILDSIIWRDWDVYPRYSSTYQFYPDSMVLLQNWSESGGLRYIRRYEFNDIGDVTEQCDYDDENLIIKELCRSYQYKDGKMTATTEQVFKSGQMDSETTTHLYYSNESRLDSTVSSVNSKEDGIYTMVTYYDLAGLKKETIVRDTMRILYRHTKRVQ